MSGFQLRRLGMLMEPEPGNPREIEGVLNPAATRGPYCPMPPKGLSPHRPGLFNSHHRLATPVSPWEKLKIGGGTPPILTKHGWLILYHGVSRMAEPVLTPELPQERHGPIANVVFPTGIGRRDDLGTPDRFDVYYGMADNRIGVARLDLPEHMSPGSRADGDGAKPGRQR